ncbi:MAG: hypothetical protein OHK0029_27210 [Armatimonadaceae bacterium]
MRFNKTWLLLALLPLLIVSLSTATTRSSEARSQNNLDLLPAPSVEAVDAAIAIPLTRYNRNSKGGAHTNRAWDGGAPAFLAFAALKGVTKADDRLLEQIRYTLTGGNDISGNGGYPAQHERHATAMFALVRRTPRIWNQLTADEKKRADLLMTGALVGSAFTTSDSNPYVLAKTQQYALDGDSNLNRGWNPNFREGMLGMLVIAPVYFGSTKRVGEVLNTFNHAAFVRELKAHGLTNLHETFTWKATHPESNAPTGEMIEKAVRDYRYLGVSVHEPMKLYWLLTTDTYGKAVNCGLNDGEGILLSDGTRAGMLLDGCAELPNKGKPGMLKELDARDANGPRSSTLYSYDGFRVNLVNHLVLVAGGLWESGKMADECVALLQVGIPDLWYKIEHGYRNYAKGKVQGTLRGDDEKHAFALTRPLWNDILQPFHAKK